MLTGLQSNSIPDAELSAFYNLRPEAAFVKQSLQHLRKRDFGEMIARLTRPNPTQENLPHEKVGANQVIE